MIQEALDVLIGRAIMAKTGNQEFALFYRPDNPEPWTAEIGNPVPAVSLGEIGGEFSASGPTPHGAVERLLLLLGAE